MTQVAPVVSERSSAAGCYDALFERYSSVAPSGSDSRLFWV